MDYPAVIEVLGPVRVVARSGVEVDAGGRAARTVLAVLAANDRSPTPSTALIDAVWGEHAPANAAASLRNHVTRLRRALESASGLPSSIGHTTLGYQLDAALLPTDAGLALAEINRCRQLATTDPVGAAETLKRVVALWRGDPFGHTTDPPALVPEREALVELRLAALELRFGLLVRTGRAGECVPELETELARHPDREHLAENLMRALYATGRQHDALLVYQRTRDHLLAEIGIEPGPALVALELAILRHEVDMEPVGAAATDHSGLGLMPFEARRLDALMAPNVLGRERTLERLERLVLDRNDAPALIGLVGDAGIGKTAIALELLRRLAGAGASVIYSRHDREEDPLPLQPWVDVVSTIQRAHPGEIGRLLSPSAFAAVRSIAPGVPGPADTRASATSAHAVHAGLSELIELVGRDRPACIVIEDAHWADSASVDVLRHLWRNPPAGEASVIITARGDELSTVLADLFDELAVCDRVQPITGLDHAVGTDLARAINPQLAAEGVARVVALSRGNPLMIEHVARATSNAAFVNELMEVHPDHRAGRLLRERLGGLDDRAHMTLGVAATIGLAFDLPTVMDISGLPESDVLAALRLALQRRVVINDPSEPDRFQFSHALFWAHLRELPLAVERARWHSDLAVRLADQPERCIEAAYHGLEGINRLRPEVVGAVALAAAEEIRRRGAHDALFDLSDRFLGTSALSPETTRRLLVHRARARTMLGQWEEARSEYLGVLPLARANNDLEVEARVAIEIDDHGRVVNDIGPRFELLRAVHADLGGIEGIDDELSIRVAAAFVTEANQFGRAESKADTDALETLATHALTVARVFGSRPALAAAVFARKSAIEWRGDPTATEERHALAAELLGHAEELADVNLQHNALLSLIRAGLQQGDLPSARRHLAAHRRLADRTNAPRVVWFSRQAESMFARLNGDMAHGSAVLDEMHAYGTEYQVPDNDGGWAAGVYFGLYHSKDRSSFAAIRPLVEAHAAKAPHQVLWALAAGLTQVADDDVFAASRTWDEMSPGLANLARNEFWPAVLCFSAELSTAVGAPASELAVVRELLEDWSAKFVVVGSVIATLGPADRYLAMLDDVLGHPTRAEDLRHRARQLCRRLGSVQWLATMSRGGMRPAPARNEPDQEGT